MVLNYRLYQEISFKNCILKDNWKKNMFLVYSNQEYLLSFSESLFLHTSLKFHLYLLATDACVCNKCLHVIMLLYASAYVLESLL